MTYNLSLTRKNAKENLTHSFNYVVPIYLKNETTGVDKVIMRFWFLDAGDVDCLDLKGGYDCVREDQLQWIIEE